MSRPAVFFDRDGVLNPVVMRGDIVASPRSLDEWRLEPQAPALIAALRDVGFMTFVITNQPDVARGLMSGETLDQIHSSLAEAAPLDDIAACRHDNADGCTCRKPKPGLVLGLASKHDVDLGASWVIGDQDRDVATGRAAGVATILLRRPYNSGSGADHTVETLSEAVALVLEGARRSSIPPKERS